VEAIGRNGLRLTTSYQIRGVEVGGPYPYGDQFAVGFSFDEVHLPTGQELTTQKLSLYTVAGGAITSEHVYYHTPPHTA
jgi:hypothetical protein